MIRRPPISTLFPSTPLSRPRGQRRQPLARQHRQRELRLHQVSRRHAEEVEHWQVVDQLVELQRHVAPEREREADERRSEEHTSELQSRQYLVCRLLLEKKKQ